MGCCGKARTNSPTRNTSGSNVASGSIPRLRLKTQKNAPETNIIQNLVNEISTKLEESPDLLNPELYNKYFFTVINYKDNNVFLETDEVQNIINSDASPIDQFTTIAETIWKSQLQDLNTDLNTDLNADQMTKINTLPRDILYDILSGHECQEILTRPDFTKQYKIDNLSVMLNFYLNNKVTDFKNILNSHTLEPKDINLEREDYRTAQCNFPLYKERIHQTAPARLQNIIFYTPEVYTIYADPHVSVFEKAKTINAEIIKQQNSA